jgi:FkbM family methyltransferase
MIRNLTLLFVVLASYCSATYNSQCGQDQFINESFFKNLRNGVFVDIGAHDGVTISNTYFFEKELDWTGICIEPIPDVFGRLKTNRKCHCICAGISVEGVGSKDFFWIKGPFEMLSGFIDKYDIRHVEHIQRLLAASPASSYEVLKVDCLNLNQLLEDMQIYHVHLLSVDTEGGEFEILQNLDFSRYHIDVITVEDNYGNKNFIPFLESKGFVFVKALHQDLVFVNKASGLL